MDTVNTIDKNTHSYLDIDLYSEFGIAKPLEYHGKKSEMKNRVNTYMLTDALDIEILKQFLRSPFSAMPNQSVSSDDISFEILNGDFDGDDEEE